IGYNCGYLLKRRKVLVVPGIPKLNLSRNRAVWDCGIDKSPGSEGFSFGFYHRYWNCLEKDVEQALRYFFLHGTFPKGGNSSFIALIPKTYNANMVKDFRPITLIGSLYKIITKILANRLMMVLGDIVNEVQYAFIANRQILDGLFILNEVYQWWKKQKKPTMIFKVDFEKAYDSVRWDYLDDVLKNFDDAVFMGKWSDSNIKTIVHVLECFHRASGLRINMNKSKIMRISVAKSIVQQATTKIGYAILTVLFSYLGSKVGDLMSRSKAWNDIINKLTARLSKWKMKTLSIGVINSLKVSIRLYALETCKSITVADKLGHENLVYSFRRHPRGGIEQEQLLHLMARMSGTTLVDMQDKWSWSLDATNMARSSTRESPMIEIKVHPRGGSNPPPPSPSHEFKPFKDWDSWLTNPWGLNPPPHRPKPGKALPFQEIGQEIRVTEDQPQVTITRGITEVLWVRRLLTERGYSPQEPTKIFSDNKAAIQISENPVQHDRTKHIEVDRHFIKEKLEAKIIALPFVRSKDQLADILTKAVMRRIFTNINQKHVPPGYVAPTTRSKYKRYQCILLILSLIALLLGFVDILILLYCGVDGNDYCLWCHYLTCIPTPLWTCSSRCSFSQLDKQVNMTCLPNKRFNSYTLEDPNDAIEMQKLCLELCWITLRVFMTFDARYGRHLRRDTIQLETAVSTLPQEYLLEFTSEYDISEDVHPELPSAAFDGHREPGDRYGGSRCSNIVFWTPFTVEKSPLDFDNKNPSSPMIEELSLEEEVAVMEPRLSKKRYRRVNDGADSNAPPKVLRKDYASVRSEQSTRRGKSLPTMRTAATPGAKHDPGLQNQTSNLKTLLEAEADMKKATETKNADLPKELESLRTQFLDLQEFKKYEDDMVEKHCAEMDARLDALSIDFDEELYPRMLTTIAGYRWAIGHDLRLAVMKYVDSIKLRQAFANVVSAGIAKGMSEGLAHGIEHGKALQELKDLKYPIVDQLESLNDAPMEAVKEEMLLEEAIATNVSRAEKKKRCRVVCRTHGIGSTHHARSDGVLVSVPTVAPQGLTILLADAATQTETSEDDASPRLLRSKSLPPMYNLDWQ
nr:RNA-directed DNA polymerase, eukaryota, reverse transcriptase zinc-binding domain protein [Tanacetum cinerariifolium]